MPVSRARWAAAVVPAAASLVLLAGAAPAFATDAYTVPLHQAKELPLFAAQYKGKPGETCASIPATQDGWHFIAPGSPNEVSFVKLTVKFEPGGEQVITTFGPPNENHAYVASAPGAKLVSAVAEVEGTTGGGKKLEWFNLSHTCPSTATTEPTPSQSTSASASASASATASASASTSASASASASTSASASSSVSPSGSASSPAPTGSAAAAGGSTGGGDLAKTGSDAPIGLIATMAGALIAAGTVLVVRRRKAGAAG
ncbi:LPXTG cell wall anchor domain-containing protein [Streptomyces sp. ISL-94]|uniref:LPXTG cell wall anchor domain-containing protein n=1 Tax=Streptomyces sp. ISL-94 TaxID=2819190 RepID=UPI001BE6C089|nr:LPXTG cell wall anchor domain-containing protein [Streptomyces sp. ISL-94]MBT2480537.1 LPXTG cell wall anchor domain-containing protein [Streptomyces sp. ISL-94]